MLKSLKNVFDILNQISSESRRLVKEEIIKSNSAAENFKKVVFYALDYGKVYNITELEEFSSGGKYTLDNIFQYLDFLSTKLGATDAEKQHLSDMAYSIDKETVDVVNRIIQKDLKCGASIKTFLKIFPDLPFFEMMTCKSDVDKFIKLCHKLNSDVFISDKKDGVRTWGKVNKYISRSGITYNNFNIFNDELLILINYLKSQYNNIPDDVFLDGEVTVQGGNFQEVMRHVRTIGGDDNPPNYQYNIFDIVLRDNTPLQKRIEMLESAFKVHDFQYLKLLNNKLISLNDLSAAVLEKEMKEANKKGEEGIVAKLVTSPYELKEKSKYWLKMKPVETYDLLVVGKFAGQGRLKGTLGGLIVKYQNHKIKVGSGYTDDERKLFMAHPPRIIEVKCKGETDDGSLREPIFVRVREDKSTVSDEN